jgi:hypothetical protein
MHLYHVLVVATFALLVTCSSLLAEATKASTLTSLDSTLSQFSNEGHGNGNSKRSLRLIEGDDHDDVGISEDSLTAEARAGVLSSLSSKISKKIPTGIKISWWRTLGKSNDYVKKRLGLAGLSGTALTKHKNYRRFVKYVDEMEGDKMYKMAKRGTLPTDIWVQQGLDKISQVTPQVKSSEAFRIYSRFTKISDDAMQSTMRSGYYLPSTLISEKATPIEMKLRVQFWVEAGRSDDFVQTMLGLNRLKGVKFTRHKNYPYYSQYFKSVKPATKT